MGVIQLPCSGYKENDFESRNAGSSSSGSNEGTSGLGGGVLEVLNQVHTFSKMDDPIHLPDDLLNGSLYDVARDIVVYKIDSCSKDLGGQSGKGSSNSSRDTKLSISDILKLSLLES